MELLKFFFEGSDSLDYFVKTHIPHVETSLENCDYIVSNQFQKGIYNKSEIQSKIDSYKKSNKKVFILMISDNESKFKLYDNIVLYRTSLQKSKKSIYEELLPYLWESLNETTSPLTKTNKPIVGFCGSIKKNLGKRLSTIKAFEKSDKITSKFILRTDFWGGKPHDSDLKKEFNENIKDSHFSICNRGRGNFSMRFYQVLSFGRIPALINTDMLFPLEESINWDQLLVLGKNEEDLVNNVITFWNNKSDEEIIEIQLQLKRIHNDFLTEEKFGKIIEKRLKERLVSLPETKKSLVDKLFYIFKK